MNPVGWQIIRKDWQFNRWPLLSYGAVGLIGLALLSRGVHPYFVIGATLLITAIVIVGAQMTFGCIINERKQQTLPFLLSLPITFVEYTRAKLVGGLLVFGIAWLVFSAAVAGLIVALPLPNGLLPFAIILLLELLVAYILLLGVTLVLEAEVWAIVVMSISNVGISIFMFLITSIPAIGGHMNDAAAAWNSTALTIIGIEVALGVGLILLTLYLQSRKTDFL